MMGHQIKEIAREEAIRRAPTERGFFDGGERLAIFAEECAIRGFVIFLGHVDDFTDEEVEEYLARYGLD